LLLNAAKLITATSPRHHPGETMLSAAKAGLSGPSAAELSDLTKRLSPRWFLMRNAHSENRTQLIQPRWAFSLLRGPMTAALDMPTIRNASHRGASRIPGQARPLNGGTRVKPSPPNTVAHSVRDRLLNVAVGTKLTLLEVVAAIASFLTPAIEAALSGGSVKATWSPGGQWVPR
jgi:hypothetical protein